MANILSLFDGMACGHIAMGQADIPIDSYIAYEIDKYAIQTATHNFPDIIEKGDVFDADFAQYKGHVDYLIGGSPCRFWSLAQKKNRETEASGLGWELLSQFVRALIEAEPKYFLYENNKSMSNAILKSITETFGFEPICINSALVSAQNRQRLYWVGKRKADGTYGKVHIDQPKDRGILLKDILETGFSMSDKSHCVMSSCARTTTREYFVKHQGDMCAEPVNITADGKSQTIKSQYHKTSPSNILGYRSTYGATGVAEPVGYNCCAAPCEWNEDGEPIKAISCADGKTYTVYKVADGQITIREKTYQIKLVDGYYIIRKLTVRECARLQQIPEWIEFPCSDLQSYKQIGNGWSISVIEYLLRATKERC